MTSSHMPIECQFLHICNGLNGGTKGTMSCSVRILVRRQACEIFCAWYVGHFWLSERHVHGEWVIVHFSDTGYNDSNAPPKLVSGYVGIRPFLLQKEGLHILKYRFRGIGKTLMQHNVQFGVQESKDTFQIQSWRFQDSPYAKIAMVCTPSFSGLISNMTLRS